MENTEQTGANTSVEAHTPNSLHSDNRGNVDIGLRILFEEMQHAFITRSRKDIAIELKKMENRTALLQDKINSLHTEVDRLSAIDLDTEFKRTQAALMHISRTLDNLSGSVGANVGNGLSGTNEVIKGYAEDAAKQLAKLDEETKTSILFLEHKIQAITEQNKSLKKSVRNNNIIQLITALLIIGGIIYIIAYEAGVRINMH